VGVNADTSPTVTAIKPNVVVNHFSPIAATSLFTATDTDGDPIVQYDFWDNGSAGGTWLNNGNPLKVGTDNFVPVSQLSQITYQGGAGTETIWERASDGIGFGAWVSLNATDTAPVVAPTSASLTVSHTSSVAASTLFTVYEEDGEPIAQYDFWDNGAGGGHWTINGQVGKTGTDNFVNATQLSQVTYTPGAGTDTLWVRASEGSTFGECGRLRSKRLENSCRPARGGAGSPQTKRARILLAFAAGLG
jgi:hypothetical protein